MCFKTFALKQAHISGETRNEYQPKCGDALQLGSKDWITPLVDKCIGGK